MNLNATMITKTWLYDKLAFNSENKRKWDPEQRITLDKKLFSNRETGVLDTFKNADELHGMETTVGRIIANIFLYSIYIKFTNNEGEEIETNLRKLVSFKNDSFGKKTVGKMGDELVEMFIQNLIPQETLVDFIDRTQWFGYILSPILCATMDINTFQPTANIYAKKKEILEKNKDVIENKDLLKFDTELEVPILDFAKEELERLKSSGMDIFNSGWNGSFTNNYKGSSIFKGITPKSNNMSDFRIMMSNLQDGVSKKDLVAASDVLVAGAAGRAKDTALGGYKTKIFNAAFSAMMVDVKDSDCGSKYFYSVNVTEDNVKDFILRYYKKGSGLEMVTYDNYKEIIGKTVEFRSPMYCHTELFCNKCIGDMPYKSNVSNIGLMISRVTEHIKNKSMKLFHDMTVKPKVINIFEYIKNKE